MLSLSWRVGHAELLSKTGTALLLFISARFIYKLIIWTIEKLRIRGSIKDLIEAAKPQLEDALRQRADPLDPQNQLFLMYFSLFHTPESGREPCFDCLSRELQLVAKDERVIPRKTKTLHVNQLPTEILSIIFCHSLPKEPSPFTDAKTMRRTAPYNLISVCRLWRIITFTSPRLWTNINVQVVSCVDGHTRDPYLVKTAERSLHRSGNIPLDVNVRFVAPIEVHNDGLGGICPHNLKLALAFIKQLGKSQARWKNLKLSLVSPSMSKAVIYGFDIQCSPLLENLSLEFPLLLPADEHRMRISLIDLSIAKSLKILDVSGLFRLYAEDNVRLLCLREARVRTIINTSHPYDTDNIFCLLRAAPALVRLCAFLRYPMHNEENVHGICSDSLQFLDLTLLSGDMLGTLAPILNNIYLPSLKSLSLRRDVGFKGNVRLTRIVPNFLERVRPPLTDLHLGFPVENDRMLIDILRLLPQLKSLSITGSCVSQTVMKAMVINATVEPLCPLLQSLSVSCSPGLKLPTVADMIISRWLANHPNLQSCDHIRCFRTVNFTDCGLETLPYHRIIGLFEFRGLKITVLNRRN